MNKKKKIKIKKKNLTIFILIIMILTFTLTQITFFLVKTISSPKQNMNKEKQKTTEIEKKLQKLNNINKKITYFNDDYIDRYLKYKKNNKNISDEQVIKDVNMNLDFKQYEHSQKAEFLNTEKILVNKFNYLQKEYVPKKLKKLDNKYALNNMRLVDYAAEAFEEMSKAADEENLNIIAMSTYRSYTYQVNLYNKYVKTDGKYKADTYSARPGYSEHQTGLAVDVYNKTENYTNFEQTKEYKWMQKNAADYGFILRFPKNKEKETGYKFEAWHYRYVGKKIAKYIKQKNISFEEYYVTKIKKW